MSLIVSGKTLKLSRKSLSVFRPPVLVALTGWAQEEDRRQSKDAGFDEHMVKPVDLSALTNLLASLPAERESQSARHES